MQLKKKNQMVIEQNACNTSDLQSKLKLVNTLKIKVFKKKRRCRFSRFVLVSSFSRNAKRKMTV